MSIQPPAALHRGMTVIPRVTMASRGDTDNLFSSSLSNLTRSTHVTLLQGSQNVEDQESQQTMVDEYPSCYLYL